MSELLEVRDLEVSFLTEGDSTLLGVTGVTFSVERGKVLGIVGETGAGKTVTTRSVLGTVRNARLSASRLELAGVPLLTATPQQLRRVRSQTLGLVVQAAREALPPGIPVGLSVARILQAKTGESRKVAQRRVLDMFEQVGLPGPESVAKRLPHELSGGMAQRVIIAAAMVKDPDLIVADEPTTALDLTVQAQILDLLHREIRARDAGAIVVTHDLGVVAQYCTDVAVMYAGRIREYGPVAEVFGTPSHPYTQSLLRRSGAKPPLGTQTDTTAGSVLSIVRPAPASGCEYQLMCPYVSDECFHLQLPLQARGEHLSLCRLEIGRPEPAAVRSARSLVTVTAASEESGVVLQVRSLTKRYRRKRIDVHAVNGIDLDLSAGETLALVGESGSGKSTVGRCVLNLVQLTSGTIRYRGEEIGSLKESEFRALRSEIQIVYQDPMSSLDGRLRAIDIIGEPLKVWRKEMSAKARRDEVLSLMGDVGLAPDLATRFPGQLSGGQAQRVAIARALATRPTLMILDEPTASLDMTVRGQVLDLLKRLQRERGLAYLFISHDMDSVARIADRVAVMYLGEIVEEGPAADVLGMPRHPYSQALLSANLDPDPSRRQERVRLTGEIPQPTDLPAGCYFASRCRFAIAECRDGHPELSSVADRHAARCIRVHDDDLRSTAVRLALQPSQVTA